MASETDIPAAHAKYDIADLSIAGVTGLMLAFTAVFLCVVPLTGIAGGHDFVVYWATGQQLVHHANPYDISARLSACLRAHSVLELPAGTIRATRTEPGDALEFSNAPRRVADPA